MEKKDITKKGGFIKNLITIIVITIVFFTVGEIIFRAFFPEYRNYILTENITYGKRKYQVSVPGGKMRARTENAQVELKKGDHAILVFGDSVSLGYGLAYEDIYWSYWQRMLDLEDSEKKIVVLSAYGNNYVSNMSGILKPVNMYKNRDIKIDGIIYQFNLNDIMPFTPEDLKAYKHLQTKSSWITKVIAKAANIRIRYLNRSVMLRVLSNKLTHLFYNRAKAECESLGIDALRQYTYSFGAIGNEEMSRNIWEEVERYMEDLRNGLGNIPIVVMLTPISQFIDPAMEVHPLSRPLRFDCATIDPVEMMREISEKTGVHFIDPSGYMKEYFNYYKQGENPTRFYFINDDNHINEVGAKYFAEYGYQKIFKEGIIK